LPTRHIVGEFLANNNPAEHLDGTTSKEEREAILARLATGETKIVSNAMVLTEGWDCPSIGCCVLARPTKHHGLFRHMIGRALRPADGKTKAIIIDMQALFTSMANLRIASSGRSTLIRRRIARNTKSAAGTLSRHSSTARSVGRCEPAACPVPNVASSLKGRKSTDLSSTRT
jgi:superfamily II DNA or RNA helicase